MGSAGTCPPPLREPAAGRWQSATRLHYPMPARSLQWTPAMNAHLAPEDYRAILDADSLDCLRQRTQSLVRRLGFDHFMIGVRIIPPQAPDTAHVALCGTYPEAWMTYYQRNALERIDPTVQHSLGTNRPMVWSNAAFRRTPAVAAYYEEALRHGVSAGCTCPASLPGGQIAAMGIARAQDADQAVADVEAILPHAHLLGSYATEVVRRLLQPPALPSSTLTRRELDCLAWLAEGLTAAEIAGRLALSERTVHFHLNNVRRKLDASTLPQAIARAIRLGLL